MRSQIGAQRSVCQNPRAFLRRETARAFADEVDARFEAIAIDMNADQVAVHEFADRSAGQAFRADVADARAGGDAGETRVGQQRDVFPERQVFERAGDLIGFLHARAHRADAREHQHIAGLDTVLALIAAIASFSLTKTRAGPSLR